MPLRYTLRQLEYFVAVGEPGSIAAASHRVNVSSPSISAAISQLEEELGVQLFVRHHAQGLTPTLPGRKLPDQAQTDLRQAAALRDLAEELSGTVRGPLALGGLSTFAQIVLPGLRRSFLELYDEVRITQTEGDQASLFILLRQARIDMALSYDLDLPGDLHFTPMLELPPMVAISDDHELAHRLSVSVQQLAGYPMVLLDRWERVRFVVIPHLMPLATFVALVQLMDNFRVFEPIVGFSSEANATSLSWLVYNDLRGQGSQLFGSAAATSVLTILGVIILLMPVLLRT